MVDQKTEARVQHQLAQTPEAQHLLRQRAIRRTISVLALLATTGLFLAGLPSSARGLLIASLIANRPLIALLFIFGAISISLLWSTGQRLDVDLFRTLNLHTYQSVWLDHAMWLATQMGNAGFAGLLAAGAYLTGDRAYAADLVLGSLTLWLLVTVIKAATDRARPFNLLSETRVIGARLPSLSFPSGHTAQTFFMMSISIRHFQLPLLVALGLYGIATLVGFTRVYLGVHYPRDVIAGAILGLIWGGLGVVLAPYL